MSLGIEWTPLINEKDAKCYHDEVIKEFYGLFADNVTNATTGCGKIRTVYREKIDFEN